MTIFFWFFFGSFFVQINKECYFNVSQKRNRALMQSTFHVSIYKNNKYKTGWSVIPGFSIGLAIKDLPLLYQIKYYFETGVIVINEKNGSAFYSVKSIKDLINIIIPHFDRYPLITRKWIDYELFKLAIKLINKKEHLTIEGLKNLVAIRASMNKGLSDELKVAWDEILPVDRPIIKILEQKKNINPNWIVGFSDAESCFFIEIFKSKTHKLGSQVKFNFSIAQHTRDIELMKSLIEHLECGYLVDRLDKEICEYRVVSFNNITDKIIPFFLKYPLQSSKLLDFEAFCKVSFLMKDKAHLTLEGLNKIKLIKAGMNRGRY